MNVVNSVFYQAQLRPMAPALITPTGVIRFGELAAIVQSNAARLAEQGIRAGDIVSVSMETSALHLVLILALARMGAVSTGNFSKGSADVAKEAAGRFGFTWVCHEEGRGAIEGIRSVVVDDSWLQQRRDDRAVPPVSGGEDVWRIAPSSGTTGRSKAIPWTHVSTLMRMALNTAVMPVEPRHRLFPMMSLHAGYCLLFCLRHLYAGSAVVLSRPSSLGQLTDAVDRYEITHLCASPVGLSRLLRGTAPSRPLMPSLECISVGGGLINDVLKRKLAATFLAPVFSNYGSTEAGTIAWGELTALARVPDAVGRLLPSAQVEAVDQGGRPLPMGQDGELRIRTPTISSGYRGDPELSAKVFRDGWFYPGDVGCVTPGGVLRVSGRTDDLINLGGIKIQPARLEGRLSAVEEVDDIAACAVPDAEGRLRVGVGIVAAGPADRAKFLERCLALLPSKLPIIIAMLDEIPRNDMGKAIRRELAERILAAEAAGQGLSMARRPEHVAT